MRFSSTLALIAAPLALAGTIQEGIVRRSAGELVVRAEAAKAEAPKAEASKAEASKAEAGKAANNNAAQNNNQNQNNNGNNGGGNTVNVINVNQGLTVTQKVTEIIIIWVNNGAGAATSTVNAPPVAAPAAAAAATHTVIVGGSAGLVYTPDQITAAVGDMVIFEFMSANHTVTQSAFAEPCKALAGGMDSGFMSNPNNSVVPAPQMAMQVTVATPIWFYCKQKTGNHCGKGMTFSINPTADKTQAMFQGMAIAQNGTGTVAPIAGGVASAAPAATNSVAPPAAQAPAAQAPAAAAPPSMAVGAGTTQGTACSCSCLCGVAAFPLAAQGVGMIGGMSGAMPMAMLEK